MFPYIPAYSVNTINRILQTSVKVQLTSVGNVSSTMCDFIDDNKFIQTLNRYPIITTNQKENIFNIVDSDLPLTNWVNNVYNKLITRTNLLIKPTLIFKHVKSHKRKKNTTDQEIDHKKLKLEESLQMLQTLKNTHFLKNKERINIINAIKKDLLYEFIDVNKVKLTLKDRMKIFQRLSDEQKMCLYNILSYVYPDDNLDILQIDDNLIPNIKTEEQLNCDNEDLQNPFYKIFLIEGYAGCGKSSIIEAINTFAFMNHKEYTKLTYITQTNILCQSMKKKCGFNADMQYLTFFKFVGALELLFEEEKQFLLNCDALKIDAFQSTFGSKFITSLKCVVNLPPASPGLNQITNKMDKPTLFIIFDEVYAISHGKLSLFLFIVRNLKLTYQRLNIICILIGDKHQLRPFTTIANAKLDVMKYESFHTEQELELHMKKFKKDDSETQEHNKDIENDLQTLISMSESLSNCTKFILTKQFRIIDEEYNKFVNFVRHSEDNIESGNKIFNTIYSLWPEKVDKNLFVNYPIDDILAIHERIQITDYFEICKEFEEKKLFDKILDTTIFCFTNNHAHYYNIAFAFAVLNRLEQKFKNCNKNYNDFICFSLIYNKYFIEPDLDTKLLLNTKNSLLNILPLIRYCPYKLLISLHSIARLSIVYLIDWIYMDDSRDITHLVIYYPDTNLCFSLAPYEFEMNRFKNITLFGFPLQLAFSSTFASSQGLTLDNKIAISCANISKAELYVCLTRIHKSDDLIRIF